MTAAPSPCASRAATSTPSLRRFEATGCGLVRSGPSTRVIYTADAGVPPSAGGGLELGIVPRGRVRGPSGGSLVVHGIVADSRGNLCQAPVMIEAGAPSEAAPLLVQEYGVTVPEQEVVLLAGLARRSGHHPNGVR